MPLGDRDAGVEALGYIKQATRDVLERACGGAASDMSPCIDCCSSATTVRHAATMSDDARSAFEDEFGPMPPHDTWESVDGLPLCDDCALHDDAYGIDSPERMRTHAAKALASSEEALAHREVRMHLV